MVVASDQSPNNAFGMRGAIPSAGEADGRILGAPQGASKSKSNVTRLFALLVIMIGLTVVVGASMYFLKTRAHTAKEAVAKVAAPQKNAEVTSASIERTKAEIMERARSEQNERERTALEAAATAQAGLPPATSPMAAGTAVTSEPTPISPQERKMSGGPLIPTSSFVGEHPTSRGSSTTAVDGAANPAIQAVAAARARLQQQPGPIDDPSSRTNSDGDLARRLQPTTLASASAGVLPNLDFLLKKGTSIPCALKTGIDTTLSGFIQCTVVSDVYSANGRTLLIERGADFFGEQRSELKQGQARAFALWNRVDNPSGVFAELNSPGVDATGFNGIPGDVDTHFWHRFGGAVMVSLVDDFGNFMSNRDSSPRGGGSGINISTTTQTASSLVADALRNSINIPPTLRVLPGTVIHILAARDVSFESVYTLTR